MIRAEKKECHGGLVGVNYKDIIDSYAVSYCLGGGICGVNRGHIVGCYADYRGTDISTNGVGIEKSVVVTKTGSGFEDWDFDNVWTRNAKGLPVFNEQTWFFEDRDTDYEEVSTAQELIELAERIESGDVEAAHSKIRLVCNIDFKNHFMIPIGTVNNPFKGKVDGAGFSVSGFRIRCGEQGAVGFFGVLIGATIMNLTVSGKVSGGSDTGIMCGQSYLSKLLYCSAMGECSGYENVGGLCGKNEGVIRQCNFYGYVKENRITMWPRIIGAVLGAELLLVASLALRTTAETGEIIYKPVNVDAHIIEIAEEVISAGEDQDNHITLQISQTATYCIGEPKVKLQMMNPAASNQMAVMELQLPENYKEHAGEKVEYNGDANCKTVAKSGAVPPGFLVEQLEWMGFEDDEVIPCGTYPAFVHIYFYDKESNEKAMIDSVFKVELKILEREAE